MNEQVNNPSFELLRGNLILIQHIKQEHVAADKLSLALSNYLAMHV